MLSIIKPYYGNDFYLPKQEPMLKDNFRTGTRESPGNLTAQCENAAIY